ncbi:MAG: sulfur carrier protein ThiS [Gemmatimonadota bacterium]
MSAKGMETRVAPATIRLRVNGTDRTVPAGETVRGLLESLDLVPATIVVEHNLEILDRATYDHILLREGDRLELVHFVGGG